MKEELRKKVDFAIKLLQGAEKMAAKVGQPVEIAYSGGKDSDVILELAKMSGINYRAIYKNTTIDPPGTIKHVREMGVEIMRPEKNFGQLIAENGLPTRMRRFCCSVLKEYKILDYCVIGVRREESRKRMERYHEPEVCRVYKKNVKVRQYLPILEWTLDDVAEFIKERGIKCAPVYYDDCGNFHSDRRLGCMGCPLKSRRMRIEDFQRNKGMLKFYLRNLDTFRKTHPKSKFFQNYCEQFVFNLFCNGIQDFRERFGKTLFDDGIDCKKFLEDYFKIKL